ncbi:hypothetical protein OPQ81_007346 [Rhizoctonia solani]|nr:hypothetical protein OPQ81_007346 [Rhizoctonia solani]
MDPVAEDSNAPDPEVILEKILDTEGHEVFMESFPCPHAGQPIRWVDQTGRPWHKYPNIGALADPKAFEIVELLMQPGITAYFQNSFLRLKRLCGKLPWQNNHALWKDIDKLPHGPDWEVQPFKLRGNSREEVVELWKSNPLDVIRAILQDKTLRKYLQYIPQRHYTTHDRSKQQ